MGGAKVSKDVVPDSEVLADEQADRIFKALAAKPRREILALLASGVGEDDERCCSADEVCACVFVEKLGLGAPTVSHHMKALIEAGFVSSARRGNWVYYRLRRDAVERLVGELNKLTCCTSGVCR